MVLRWPMELEKTKADDLLNAEGEIAGAHLGTLRDSGAQAVVLARGGRTCADVEVCAARVEIRLLDLGSQEELWQSEAGATTALSQGDEMKAAVSRGARRISQAIVRFGLNQGNSVHIANPAHDDLSFCRA